MLSKVFWERVLNWKPVPEHKAHLQQMLCRLPLPEQRSFCTLEEGWNHTTMKCQICNTFISDFSQVCHLYNGLVDDYGLLHDDDHPLGTYLVLLWDNNCNDTKLKMNCRFAWWAVFGAVDGALWFAIDELQYTKDLITCNMRIVTMVMKEWMKYKKKQDGAVLSFKNVCSFIFDEADQLSFGLSHFVTKSQEEAVGDLKICLIGLLEHKKSVKSYFHTTKEERDVGSNLLVETIPQVYFWSSCFWLRPCYTICPGWHLQKRKQRSIRVCVYGVQRDMESTWHYLSIIIVNWKYSQRYWLGIQPYFRSSWKEWFNFAMGFHVAVELNSLWLSEGNSHKIHSQMVRDLWKLSCFSLNFAFVVVMTFLIQSPWSLQMQICTRLRFMKYYDFGWRWLVPPLSKWNRAREWAPTFISKPTQGFWNDSAVSCREAGTGEAFWGWQMEN